MTDTGHRSRTAPQSAAAPSPFPPIADYAFLSNCHTGALVAPDGAIDWLCVPAFDSPSIFGSLLDREAGFFRLGAVRDQPSRPRVRYEPGTNVLVTTWKTPAGWIVVRDALTMGPRDHEDDGHAAHPAARRRRRRPHARSHGRVPRGLGRGRARLRAGRSTTVARRPSGRSSTGAGTSPTPAAAGLTIRLVSDIALGIEGNRVRGRHTLEAGDRAYCALSWAEQLEAPADVAEADARIATTARFWRGWLGRARIPDHRFREPIQRSALAIKGLTYMPTGATVAALTTSLPETPGGERNWDYRYTWMRDTTFTLQALHWLNLDWEADEFMQFVADIEPTEDGSLQIMYGIDGRRDLTESTLDHLSGYAGARPVRIGNGAFDQRQNDVFGAVLDSILLHTRHSERLPRRLWPIVQSQAECAIEGLAGARPGHLGGPRRAAALRLVEADGLGRARPRGDSSPRSAATPIRRRPGGRPPRRSGRTSSSTASRNGASCASTTRPTRSTPRCSWPRSSASCPATTSACRRP